MAPGSILCLRVDGKVRTIELPAVSDEPFGEAYLKSRWSVPSGNAGNPLAGGVLPASEMGP